MNKIIEVENIAKKYIIYDKQSYNTLRDKLAHPIQSLRQPKEEFWALKNISFSVEKGEALGIIGKNGAGKSTILKILSQITPPTEGQITMRGRVGCLLEVGTGFHQELSGRENVFFSGAILGMNKKEIEKKFDDIVEFAGMEKFLDTPVKRYSSGMRVKLAFSVAAHLDPEILIIDEVLSVGDEEFKKKSVEKMHQIINEEGRTIVFVSHDMDAVQKICSRCILIENGQIKKIGETDKIISLYK